MVRPCAWFMAECFVKYYSFNHNYEMKHAGKVLHFQIWSSQWQVCDFPQNCKHSKVFFDDEVIH